jgi:hypothetical protein
MLRWAAVAGVVLLAGCRSLPEPESPAAQAYKARCGDCHRAYMPGSMTWPMWEYQLGRMKLLYAQLRRPWLTPQEESLVTDYLKRHAEGQEPQP